MSPHDQMHEAAQAAIAKHRPRKNYAGDLVGCSSCMAVATHTLEEFQRHLAREVVAAQEGALEPLRALWDAMAMVAAADVIEGQVVYQGVNGGPIDEYNAGLAEAAALIRESEHLPRAPRELTEAELIEVLTTHLPVIVSDANGVRPAGCSCGQDPLDLTEHVARALIAAREAGETP